MITDSSLCHREHDLRLEETVLCASDRLEASVVPMFNFKQCDSIDTYLSS